MVKKFVPSGRLEIYTEKLANEVVEKYLADSWTEDDTPKKSEIRFGYLLNQNVGDNRTSLSLKCLDGGQDVIDKGTNFASAIYLNKVIVHMEGRKIMNNATQDYPIELEQMKLKIINVINTDPTYLKSSEGYHRMVASTSDPISKLKDKQNWFYVDVYITVTRFMSQIDTDLLNLNPDFNPLNYKPENYNT